MDTSTKSETVVPDAVAPAVGPKEFHLPLVANNTQAQRLAKYLFGPLAQIRHLKGADPEFCVQIFVRKGSAYIELGYGKDNQTALEAAFEKVVEAQKVGKAIANVMPVKPARNIVEEKRRDLVVKLPDVKDVDVIAALHPNEVLDIIDLVQVRDYKSIDPYIAAATARNEVRKAELAKLMKEAEELKAKILAENAKVDPKIVDDKPLFNVPTEDVVVLK